MSRISLGGSASSVALETKARIPMMISEGSETKGSLSWDWTGCFD